MLKELSQIPPRSIINGELVHYKTKEVKDLFIIHCTMAWNSQYLYGKTWGDSRKLIETIEPGKHVKVSQVWPKGFWDLFQEADGQVIEGIVLKDPKGLLQYSTTPLDDVSWMMKIRKPNNKYNF
jgi:hypothetical protein